MSGKFNSPASMLSCCVKQSVWFTLLSLPLTAFLIDFGRIHHHNGDTLVPVLMSIHRWLPFYWGQARFGMLVPLLAMPLRDPIHNLLFQTYLTVVAFLAVPFLMARYLYPREMTWILGAMVLVVGFLTLDINGYRLGFMLPDQPYSVGMCCALAGLVCLDDAAISGGGWFRGIGLVSLSCILLLIGAWVNMGLLFSLVPLVFLRSAFRDQVDEAGQMAVTQSPAQAPSSSPVQDSIVRRWVRRWAGLVLLVASLGIIIQLARFAPMPHELNLDPRDKWVEDWQTLLTHFHDGYFSPLVTWTLIGLLIFGILGLYLRFGNSDVRRSAVASVILLLTAVILSISIAPLGHVRQNGFPPRYMTDGYLMIQFACVGLAVAVVQIGLASELRHRVQVALAFLIVISSLTRFGIPSPAKMILTLNREHGSYIDVVERSKATHIAGDYWTVWPTMFLYDTRPHPEGSPKILWGVANRVIAIKDLVYPKPGQVARIAVPIGQEKEAEAFLRLCGMWPCQDEGTFETVRIWRFEGK